VIYLQLLHIPQDLHLELLTPEAAAMHRALRCLVAQLRDGAEANSTPLGLHVAQLQGCMAKAGSFKENVWKRLEKV
jgi:hypothetical protein